MSAEWISCEDHRLVPELYKNFSQVFGQVLRLELVCIVSTENLGELKEARQRKASLSFYQNI